MGLCDLYGLCGEMFGFIPKSAIPPSEILRIVRKMRIEKVNVVNAQHS